MKRGLARMRSRWGVGPFGLVAILTVFALTGLSSVYLSRPILGFLLPPGGPTWLEVVLHVLVVFPLYQVLLLGFGALFGKFHFFWRKEKYLAQQLRRWLIGFPRTTP